MTSVGTKLQLRIDSMGRLGDAMASHDGKPVFVFGGIPGELVVAVVLKEHRNYIVARVIEALEPSPNRSNPPCIYFGECTGCQWQHMDYTHQLELKRYIVEDAFQRIGGFNQIEVQPTLPSQPLKYRNHARFTVSKPGTLGFVHRDTKQFVRIDECLLMHSGINQVLKVIQDHCEETSQLSVRFGVQTGSLLIQPNLKSEKIPLKSGQKHYHERLGNHTFQVGSPSFFQTNTAQTEVIVDLVRTMLALNGNELLVDAYAGVGTFAVLLAQYTRRVIAIEESASAVTDARTNIQGIPKVSMLKARTEDALLEMVDVPDAVILDPPRTGCHPSVLTSLIKLAPNRVVYVSCDPLTLARDLKLLCQDIYKVDRVQPVDMFPQTYHVECVVSLSRKDTPKLLANNAKLILASSSPRRRQILEDAGLQFQVITPSADENLKEEMSSTTEAIVEKLALAKATSCANQYPNSTIIGADTLVVLGRHILGKPKDPADAKDMLAMLRGTTHKVITGVAIIKGNSDHIALGHRVSLVTMRQYSEQDVNNFVASGEASDKAGAYAIQDTAFRPSDRIEGCYLNIVGLPLCLLGELSQSLNVLIGLSDQSSTESCHQCHIAKKRNFADRI